MTTYLQCIRLPTHPRIFPSARATPSDEDLRAKSRVRSRPSAPPYASPCAMRARSARSGPMAHHREAEPGTELGQFMHTADDRVEVPGPRAGAAVCARSAHRYLGSQLPY